MPFTLQRFARVIDVAACYATPYNATRCFSTTAFSHMLLRVLCYACYAATDTPACQLRRLMLFTVRY